MGVVSGEVKEGRGAIGGVGEGGGRGEKMSVTVGCRGVEGYRG